MRVRHVIGIAGALLALAGCSSPAASGSDRAAEASPSPSASPALSACKELFQPGKTVDKVAAANGCTDASGAVQQIGAIDCKDGTALWQVDATTGAPAGYVVDGKPYVALKGDIATDEGYRKTYEACMGTKTS